jgi:hypothetical protein
VSLLVYNGLRIAEVLACDVESFTHQRGHRVLRIVRKGGKASTEPLSPIVLRALEDYVGERTTGPLFLNVDGTERLSYSIAYKLIRRLARRAGIPAAERISPNSLRHSFATELLGAGVSLRMSRTPWATPTPAPPGPTTAPATTSTATRRTRWPPSFAGTDPRPPLSSRRPEPVNLVLVFLQIPGVDDLAVAYLEQVARDPAVVQALASPVRSPDCDDVLVASGEHMKQIDVERTFAELSEMSEEATDLGHSTVRAGNRTAAGNVKRGVVREEAHEHLGTPSVEGLYRRSDKRRIRMLGHRYSRPKPKDSMPLGRLPIWRSYRESACRPRSGRGSRNGTPKQHPGRLTGRSATSRNFRGPGRSADRGP